MHAMQTDTRIRPYVTTHTLSHTHTNTHAHTHTYSLTHILTVRLYTHIHKRIQAHTNTRENYVSSRQKHIQRTCNYIIPKVWIEAQQRLLRPHALVAYGLIH